MELTFVTTNSYKYEIAQQYFAKYTGQYVLTQYAIDTPEIQDASCETVALHSAQWAARETGLPCIKMDVGFFIQSLNGFPGPFVKYINDWLSPADLMRLMADVENRSAYYLDVLAIAYPDGSHETFSYKTEGTIATQLSDHLGKWPTDGVFVPRGSDRTLAEMSEQDIDGIWGDGVWPQLTDYLDTQQ